MNYENCTFSDLDKLEIDDVNFYITTGLFISSDNWMHEPLTEMAYGKVMELLMMFESEVNLSDIVSIIKFVSGIDCRGKLWHSVFAHYNWIASEVKKIEDMLKSLYVEPSTEEAAAGIDMFSQFGAFSTIDRLSGGDPLKYEAIENMPFNIIFTKLKLNKVTCEYEENLRKVWKAKG